MPTINGREVLSNGVLLLGEHDTEVRLTDLGQPVIVIRIENDFGASDILVTEERDEEGGLSFVLTFRNRPRGGHAGHSIWITIGPVTYCCSVAVDRIGAGSTIRQINYTITKSLA